MKQRLPNSTDAARVFACLALALATSLSACTTSSTNLVSGPSMPSPINASIETRANASAASFVSFGCSVPAQFVVPIDLRISALDPASLDRVTIRLLDGTNVGGPMITFPRDVLASRFGTIDIPARTTRIFSFAPSLTCGALRPRAIAADITVMLGGLRTHQLTVTSPLE